MKPQHEATTAAVLANAAVAADLPRNGVLYFLCCCIISSASHHSSVKEVATAMARVASDIVGPGLRLQ
jgi:hypothetical protein